LQNGRPKGYAFIEFLYSEVAQVVAETMNNYLMCGRLLKGRVCQLSITCTDSITDLGIFLDYKLHFLNHVNYIFIIVLSYWVQFTG
jgi:hypothetical protein